MIAGYRNIVCPLCGQEFDPNAASVRELGTTSGSGTAGSAGTATTATETGPRVHRGREPETIYRTNVTCPNCGRKIGIDQSHRG
jgi:predicted RNA-binding Zn-ribbon protein involved in translation (DUF1610 family)